MYDTVSSLGSPIKICNAVRSLSSWVSAFGFYGRRIGRVKGNRRDGKMTGESEAFVHQ